LEVETVAGGQVPPDENIRLLAELASTKGDALCGMACCVIDGQVSDQIIHSK
jgi:hypothetical protein